MTLTLRQDRLGDYPAAEVLPEMDPNTELEFCQSVSRQAGTGYADDIYRIVGTDDAVIVECNLYNNDDGFHDSVRVVEGYFAERRNYGVACGEASRRLALPFQVVLAVGPEFADEYKVALDLVERKPDRQLYHELVNCGIERRKSAILWLIGENISDELYSKVQNFGQVNSDRIARHLARKVAPWKSRKG